MTLKELKKMIAEEYAIYKKELKEQPADPMVAVSDADVDMEGGSEDAEATLKDIFDMLKDYFEKDDAADDADDKEDDKKDDAADDAKDDEEAESPAALQERFQRLANIIKG